VNEVSDSEQRDIVFGFIVGFLVTSGISWIPQLFFISGGIEWGALAGGLILSIVIGGVGAAIAAGFRAIGAAMRTDSKSERHRLYTDPPESDEQESTKRSAVQPAEPKSMEDKIALIRRMTQGPSSDDKESE
jgi:hypothetical protein